MPTRGGSGNSTSPWWGAGASASAHSHLVRHARARLGRAPSVGVFEGGPFDLTAHLANTPGFRRMPFLRQWSGRVGGKSVAWGVSAPRPPGWVLDRWPYPRNDLDRRFEVVEAELGVTDPTPGTGGPLERLLLERLADAFPDAAVRPAPLAINRRGERWTSVKYVPDLVENHGVKLVPRFRVSEVVTRGGAAVGVRGRWRDGRTYEIGARAVLLATGPEASLALLGPLARGPLTLHPSDHIRIDAHGRVAPEACHPHLAGLAPTRWASRCCWSRRPARTARRTTSR